jgi:hypothetical protein
VIPLDRAPAVSSQHVSFELVDLRPAEAKELHLAKDGRLFHQYGDKQFMPERMAVFKSTLVERLGQKLTGHKIEVTRFEFLAFVPGAIKELQDITAAGAIGGALGAAVAASVADNADGGDEFICSLDATVDGKPIAVSDRVPIPGYLDLSPAKEAGKKLTFTVIDTFTAKVEAELK